MRLLNSIRTLLRRWPDDPRTVELVEHLPRHTTSGTPASRAYPVLVQCVGDPYFLGIFAGCSAALSKRQPIEYELFVLRSVDAAIGVDKRAWVRRAYLHSGWFAQQWVRVYRRLFNARVGYRSVSWSHPLADCRALVTAWSIWRQRRDGSSLESLHAEGIRVGDLVIDTYLRFRPAATVDPADPFLLYVLWQALRDAKRARRYFTSRQPRLYLTSFSSYVQHGIAARTALLHGTPVVCFGNLQQLGKQLSVDDPFHTKNPVRYREDFERRADGAALRKRAREQLDKRLAGGIDTATAYMATSAYADTGSQSCPKAAGAVIVFLHDFFDSPHIYADLVFPDFWTWICCTVDTLLATGRPFALKPHPNQVAESVAVIERLRQRYPTVPFIDPAMSNLRLVSGGMKAAVTMYGTVVHELAYLGVPSIACARHPHVAFDFCSTAKSREHYVALLKSAHDMRFIHPEDMREQVLAFYAMHNLDGDDRDVAAVGDLVAYWRACLDPQADARSLAAGLEQLINSPGFSRLVDRLESLVLQPRGDTEAGS